MNEMGMIAPGAEPGVREAIHEMFEMFGFGRMVSASSCSAVHSVTKPEFEMNASVAGVSSAGRYRGFASVCS